jgi:hypothetical protein
MPTFVIRTIHTPDQCPTSNSKLRDRIQEQGPQIPKTAERLGVKIIVGPLVLGSEHEGVLVVEAERIEAINDFLLESGLIQWQTCRVSFAQSMPEALGELHRAPAPLH